VQTQIADKTAVATVGYDAQFGVGRQCQRAEIGDRNHRVVFGGEYRGREA
jgi:hypothetical protein